MNERIKKLRKSLNLTLEAFGGRIGIGKSAASKIEKGRNGATDQTIKSICREFGVNENWLRYGKGSMFRQESKNILERLSQEYNLSPLEHSIISTYLRLEPEYRAIIMKYVDDTMTKYMAMKSAEKADEEACEITDEEAAAMAAGETEAFRQQKIAEIKGKARSSESCATNSEPTGKTSSIPEPSMNSSTQNGYSERINGKEVAG